jgi:hypothetical protein
MFPECSPVRGRCHGTHQPGRCGRSPAMTGATGMSAMAATSATHPVRSS